MRNNARIRPARTSTCECHTGILSSPIVGGGTDGGEYGCHDRKADTIRDEDDARDGFGTTQPREDTLSRDSTGRAWTNGLIVASGSSEALEQSLGIIERTDTLWDGMDIKNKTRRKEGLRCRRCSRLSGTTNNKWGTREDDA